MNLEKKHVKNEFFGCPMKSEQISILTFLMEKIYANVVMMDDKEVSNLTMYLSKETFKD